MNETKTRPRKWPAAILAALLGGVYGFATTLFAALLTGAGHGWMSGCISGFGIILVPLASIAWVYRGTFASRALAAFTLVSACAVDAYLLVATKSEGFSCFSHVLSVLPGTAIPWLILWILRQVALAAFAFHDVFLPKRNV
jgi:hypothetical protein